MKSICKVTRFLALAGLSALLFASYAEATPIISVSPSSQNATVGDTVSADIIVSNLTPGTAVGGASFDLAFNNSILNGLDFVLDPGSDMHDGTHPLLDLSFGFTPGNLDIFFTAGLPPASLPGLQGSGFTLATVRFTAVGAGLSGLDLSAVGNVFLSAADGVTTLPATAVNGDVCVGTVPGVPGNCATAAVPEPATFGLLATGVAALVRRRRNRKA